MIEVHAGSAFRLGRALVISFMVTAGFILLFGGVGLVVSAGGQFIVDAMPAIGLAIGAVLAVLGLWMLTGKGKLYFGLAQRASARLNIASSNRPLSFFVFGIAYGLVSLSCTLPIYLIVVVSSLTAGNYIDGLIQFIYYALGMGLVLTALTVMTALFKGAVAANLKAVMPYVERASALLVTVAGLFIVYYWISIGGIGPDSWQVDWLNRVVEASLGNVTNESTGAVSSLPGYAFGAGMLATINPCGFALLPAYLSLYVAGGDPEA